MASGAVRHPLIVIVGETASGKSALAIDLAERFGGEIICADAMTVRRDVDIGTAKPTVEDRKRVPHHLLDVVGPCQEFTAAVFKDLAIQTIEDIGARGRVPIMVGGTGLYVDSVLFDYSFLPAGNRIHREELNRLTADDLLVKVQAAGIDTTAVDVRNKRRLMRLLETGGQRATRKDIRSDTLMIGITMPRERLKDRIERRVDGMLAVGLEQEVKELSEKNGWQCEALKGIGYREWREYFEGARTLEETRDSIIKSTLDLAKRQRTWFKRNDSIQWINHPSQAVDIVTTFLNK